MLLIIGGAYQGKLDYAKRMYGVREEDVYDCRLGADGLDATKKVWYGLEHLMLSQLRNKINTLDYMKESEDTWKDNIIICEDISCGVVPIEEEMRRLREVQGQTLSYLSQKAEGVVRIFCGLESRLK